MKFEYGFVAKLERWAVGLGMGDVKGAEIAGEGCTCKVGIVVVNVDCASGW